MGSLAGTREIRTFKMLDQIITILGTTKTTFFPFLEAGGDEIRAYKRTAHTLTAVSGGPGFDALLHPGGVHSYLFDSTYAMHLLGTDHANLSFASNAAMSIGCWILPYDITTVDIISKYDTNNLREYKLGLKATSEIELEAYDETQNADRTGPSDTAIVTDVWSQIVVTNDGADANASMDFYVNGAADGDANTETGAGWASLEDTAQELAIGCSFATNVPTNCFDGRIALPFICGKELSANEVAMLYNIGRTLLGV